MWLADKICPLEMSRDRLRTALLARCREEKIEPPKAGRVECLMGAAEAMFERQFTTGTLDRPAARRGSGAAGGADRGRGATPRARPAAGCAASCWS